MAKAKPVISTNLQLEERYYPSANVAAKALQIPVSGITRACREKGKSANGLLWRLVGEKFNSEDLEVITPYNELFFSKDAEIHGTKYDYSNSVVTGSLSKPEIRCNVCGLKFNQQAHIHLTGSGCPACARRLRGDEQAFTNEQLISRFKEVHGDTYDYSKVTTKCTRDKALIICKTHGEFTQRASGHLEGRGCRQCNAGGFNSLKPATLYYLKVSNKGQVAYKVGITNKTVEARFKTDMQFITTLKEWKYEIGADAYTTEQQILQLNKEYKYTGPSLLKDGNTELFTVDIGGFDNE